MFLYYRTAVRLVRSTMRNEVPGGFSRIADIFCGPWPKNNPCFFPIFPILGPKTPKTPKTTVLGQKAQKPQKPPKTGILAKKKRHARQMLHCF